MAKYKRYKKKKTEKAVAWAWMSRWVRLKAVLVFQQVCGTMGDGEPLAQCYTCGTVVNITKKGGGQAGHFRSRGIGGSSGLYFDERAIRVQCSKCNTWRQGQPTEFRLGLVDEYGEEIVLELERIHKLPSRWGPKEYYGLILHYKAEVAKLLEETGIRKWW